MMKIPFDIEQQRCTEWCWAAVVAAVCRAYGDDGSPGQCEIASLIFGPNICTRCDCVADPFASCNQPRNLAVVLDRVQHDRGNSPQGTARLGLEDIKKDIDLGHPIVVAVRLDDPASSGHAVAIYGYDNDVVLVADPMHPHDNISIRFEEFVNRAPTALHGIWQSAYLTRGRNE